LDYNRYFENNGIDAGRLKRWSCARYLTQKRNYETHSKEIYVNVHISDVMDGLR